MKKILSALLVLSLVLYYPILLAEESTSRVFNNHSLLPISIVSLMPDINVVVYMHGPHSYWIDTQTGCHYVLPGNEPKHGENGNNECNDNQEKDPLIYDFNNARVIFNPLVEINQTDNSNI